MYDGKLIGEVEERTEPKVEKFHIFEENEATIVMRYKGRHMKGLSTHGDFFGELSCVGNALLSALETMKAYEIDQDSEATIEIELRRYREARKKTGETTFSGEDEYERVDGKYPEVIFEGVIWSSKNPVKEIAHAEIEKQIAEALEKGGDD